MLEATAIRCIDAFSVNAVNNRLDDWSMDVGIFKLRSSVYIYYCYELQVKYQLNVVCAA